MRRYLKTFFLVILCISASTYVVMESAGYYQGFYQLAGQSIMMGWYTAVLSEVFQLTLVMLLSSESQDKTFRFIVMLIVTLIFLLTVFAAGMNIGKPLIYQWSTSIHQDNLIDLLKDERRSIKNELEIFKSQNQKVNTVLTVQEGRKTFQDLKEQLKNKPPSNPFLIQIELISLWCLRVLIQLANLFCGHFLAKSWKKSVPKKTSFSEIKKNDTKLSSQNPNSNLQTQFEKVIKYLKRNGGKATRIQILSSRIFKGGVEEYDTVLSFLEKHDKIKTDRNPDSKKLWVYSVV
jgi:hypothetical protein